MNDITGRRRIWQRTERHEGSFWREHDGWSQCDSRVWFFLAACQAAVADLILLTRPCQAIPCCPAFTMLLLRFLLTPLLLLTSADFLSMMQSASPSDVCMGLRLLHMSVLLWMPRFWIAAGILDGCNFGLVRTRFECLLAWRRGTGIRQFLSWRWPPRSDVAECVLGVWFLTMNLSTVWVALLVVLVVLLIS